MIGAIKRRWKSKKAKVLHKGSELSSSSDSCPTSRGFVDGPDDFEKMIKPPSPRQVHPVLEKSDLKFHNFHHLLQQNNGNSTPATNHVLQQPPKGKKCSTLPSSEDGDVGGSDKTEDGCHFIRVNSGRIELVSKDSAWKTNSSLGSGCEGGNSFNSSPAERLLNRHLKNEVRHSWCGSASRPQQQKTCDIQQEPAPSRHSEDQPCLNRGRAVSNNNNRIYPQEDIPHLYHLTQTIPSSQQTGNADEIRTISTVITNPATATLSSQETSQTPGGTGLLSPLRERLKAIEQLTSNLQNWQTTEKTEYEKCVSDLASQVSRAVALQQLMKGEVEKLQQRVVDLENHNKAMATMIIPTLMKLHDTTLSVGEGPQLKSIEAAPTSRCSSLRRKSSQSLQEEQCSPSSAVPFPENNGLSTSSSLINRNESIRRDVQSSSPSSSLINTSKMKGICQEQNDSFNDSQKSFTTGGSLRREKIASSPTPVNASQSPRSSPVKAPRTSLNRSDSSNSSRFNRLPTIPVSPAKEPSSLEENTNQTSLEISTCSSNSSYIASNNGTELDLETSVKKNNCNSKSWTASRGSVASSGIPRMSTSTTSSPARTSRLSQGPSQGTPKPARKMPATASERSCSPQRTSKLPVRKAPLPNRPHPAATSKSLPSHNNMETAFQTKAGTQVDKHSKSSFGFGSKIKPSVLPNKLSNKRNCSPTSSSSTATANPPVIPGATETGNGAATTAKPLKLVSSTCAVVAGITKAGGKDEGYSTMSSEALAEQEHLLHTNTNPGTSSLGAGDIARRGSKLADFASPFLLKSLASSGNASLPTKGKSEIASLPKTNKITGIGSPTTVLSSVIDSSAERSRNGTSLHKSNTFNTFREVNEGNQRQRSYRGCDVDDESEDEVYRRGNNRRQFTSLPNSSSSASSSPSKGRNNVSSASNNTSNQSPSKRSTKSGKSHRVTKTRMSDGNIVRIVRGSPYSVQLGGAGEGSGDDMEDEEDPSSSTILWEDSDDSDILFLPLEMSTEESEMSSRSTLVPQPQSSGDSRKSYYSSWGRDSVRTTPATITYSTLEKGGGGGSSVISDNDSLGSGSKQAYPLRRTKGEVKVDVLLVNGRNNGGGGVGSKIPRKLCSNGFNGDVITNEDNNQVFNNAQSNVIVDNQETTEEWEEKALIEKWMQLEEVRNEQVQGEEQWAWDWDGVERTYTRVLRNGFGGGKRRRNVSLEVEEDEEEINIDLILEESGIPECSFEEEKVAVVPTIEIDSSTWTKSKKKKGGEDEAPSSLEASPEKVRGKVEESTTGLIMSMEDNPLIKSTKMDGFEMEGEESNRTNEENTVTAKEQEDEPTPVIEFTPEFYRLANYGSNLSFSDNECNNSAASPGCNRALNNLPPDTHLSPSKNQSPKKRKPSRRSHSITASDLPPKGGGAFLNKKVLISKMDDKVSQTDFSCSSLENMSSVSSEFSAECHNCLDVIKKLVANAGADTGDEESEDGFLQTRGSQVNSVKAIGKGGECGPPEVKEINVDGGSYATTWISVPKGLPTVEVDRILEILSSSESEGVLSPSK